MLPGPPPGTTGSKPPWPPALVQNPPGPGPPAPDTIWDQPAEELYPDDRSPPDLGYDPPDSTELPSWVELIKEGRRARAYGGTVDGYSWGTIPI